MNQQWYDVSMKQKKCKEKGTEIRGDVMMIWDYDQKNIIDMGEEKEMSNLLKEQDGN